MGNPAPLARPPSLLLTPDRACFRQEGRPFPRPNLYLTPVCPRSLRLPPPRPPSILLTHAANPTPPSGRTQGTEMEGIRATRLSVGVRETGCPRRVAANDVARLMYYLHCVTVRLGMDVLQDHLVKDTRWARLTAADTDAVYRAALVLSPDQFLHTVLFQDATGAYCGGDGNQFVELTAVTDAVSVTLTQTLRGQRRQARRVMFFRRAWLDAYYLEPLRRGASRLARIAVADALGGSGPAAAGAHCAHCKGRAADCACTAVCARTAASQCSPTLASLWSALVVGAL